MSVPADGQRELVGRLFGQFVEWHNRQYAVPAPHYVKQMVLLRHSTPASLWIETGTYLGETTALLSQVASLVYSIEPEPRLYQQAVANFQASRNVKLLHGLSEEILPGLLPQLTGDINFWLDGHYSAGITFKGPRDTPVVQELAAVADNLDHFQRVTVLVDDVRCFDPRNPEYADYPTADFLVRWATEHRFGWSIEHDIFIAKNH